MTEPFGYGGVQSDLLTLSEDLTARGHRVYVATTEGELLRELQGRGAIHVDIDFHFRNPIHLLRAARQLRTCVEAEHIDLVAPQSVRSALATYFALHLGRVKGARPPVVVTIHNIHNPVHFRYAGRILNRCADYVIFESHYEHRRVVAGGLPAGKSTVIHSGIDTGRFTPMPKPTDLLDQYRLHDCYPVFGIVARLSEEKGHRYLVEAFAKAAPQLPRARLLIIGDGPLLASTRSLVADLALDDRITFTGPQRDIPRFMALMDVFVLASTRESFPLAAREAMAAGKPVIAPDIGGCPEVVDAGVTGYLFAARDVEQLASRMVEIASGTRVSAFGAAGRDRVLRLFSRESWVTGDEAVYLSQLRQRLASDAAP